MSEAITWPFERSIDARAHHATVLGRSLDRNDLTPALREQIIASLTLAAEDPSPRVRYALAEAIAGSTRAPTQIVAQLAADRPDIAGIVIARSPVLSDRDVPELAGRLDPRLLPTLAARVSSDESAQAILVQGEAQAAVSLLLNPDIPLSLRTLETISEMHGEHARVRDLLLEREDLPISARYALVDRLCTVLSSTALVTNILGEGRSRHILNEAQGSALIAAVAGRDRREIDVLVGQLCERSAVDATTLLRAIAFGEYDLFASLVCRLADVGSRRVRSVLRGARQSVVTAMLERCGLSHEIASFVASAYRLTLPSRVSGKSPLARMATELSAETNGTATLLNAIRRWHRDAARGYAHAA